MFLIRLFKQFSLKGKKIMAEPLVSIVTVTYNLVQNGRSEYIRQCIESVYNQTYKNIEHIIIDGASNDGTLDIIREYENKGWLKSFSEPDKGIYFAMNKGIDKAKGKYIVFLNSDDFWHDKNGIEESVKLLEKENADFSYANCNYLDKDDNFLGVLSPTVHKFFVRMPFCHQTMLTKTALLRDLSKFDVNYKSSADYDFVLKLILSGAKGVQIPLNFTSYRWIGFSATQASSVGDTECKNIFKKLYKDKYQLSDEQCLELWNNHILQKDFLSKIMENIDEKIKETIVTKRKTWKNKRSKYIIPEEICFRKINLLFDGNLLANYYAKSSARTGIFSLIYNVLMELSKRPELNIFICCDYTNEKIVKRFCTENQKDFPNLNLFEGDINKIDIYLSPFFKISEDIKKSGIDCYTVIYDLTPILLPDFHPETKPDTHFMQMINSLDKDDYLFSISDYTKKDFIKYIPNIDKDKITTALLAAGDNFYHDKNQEKNILIREKYNIPKDKKYIFSLCTLEPRKNLIFVVKNFVTFLKENKIEDLVFVLGGGHWDMFIEKLNKGLENLDEYKNKIIKAGYIDDEDLASLYSNSEFMVYASVYEGFGLPPLEAMKCGCPVISSNTTSLPEVVADAGIMIDPKDDKALKEAYSKLYYDKTFRETLSKKGLERAKEFSWYKCADIMVKQFLNTDLNKDIKSCLLKGEKQVKLFSKYSLINIKKDFGFTRFLLFNKIPLLKIKERNYKLRYYLFGFLPFLKIKQFGKMKKYYLFNFIPIFTKDKTNLITSKPIVTIVTVTYNLIREKRKESFIKAIESVRNQTYKNIEHIIIDGASDDGTIDLLQEYADKGFIKYISEPDSGIYDAMNKGARLSLGKYILFLNSDDCFIDKKGIEKSVKLLERTNADASYSKAEIVDNDENPVVHRHNKNNFVNIFTEMPFCHQTMLIKTDVFKELGMFDLNYKSAADYAFVMKMALNKCRFVYVPIKFVNYKMGGYSNTDKEKSISETLQIYLNEYNKFCKMSLEDCDKLYSTKNMRISLLLKLIFNSNLGFLTNLTLLTKYLRKSIIKTRISFKNPYLEIFGIVLIKTENG